MRLSTAIAILCLLADCVTNDPRPTVAPSATAETPGPASAQPAPSAPSAPSAEPSLPAATSWLPPWAGPETPAAVVDRPPIPFCGVVESGFGGDGDQAPRDCFLTAVRAGLAAEYAVTRTTTEGDPIATIYRSHAGGGLDILHDSTKDAFGSGVWSLTSCRGVVEGGRTGFEPIGCAAEIVLR